MRNCFSKSSAYLFKCIACLDPWNGFAKFDVDKLAYLASLYAEDFSHINCMILPQQLETFLSDLGRDKQFFGIKNLRSLGKKMIETMKNNFFSISLSFD